jgi:phage baseplate assembly protein V
MRAIQNAMRLQAQRAMASVVTSRVGEITNYDPNTFTARVQLQPDSIISGWMPVASPWIGNGWGMFATPNIGDMVTVDYINGDLEAGVIVGRLWNLQDLPLAVNSGEFWLVHASGQFVKLTNDGRLTVSDGHGATVYLDGSGNIVSNANQWTHTGPMSIDGNVAITGNATVSETLTATTDVIGGNVSLLNHLTSGVTAGSSSSGPPIPL